MFIPLAFVVFPSTILTVGVLIKIVLVARSRVGSVWNMLKLQGARFSSSWQPSSFLRFSGSDSNSILSVWTSSESLSSFFHPNSWLSKLISLTRALIRMHPGFVIGKEQDDNKNNNNNNNHQLTNPHCLSICRFFCVVSGAGQNNCSSRAEPYVPNSGLYYFGEILVSLLGVVLFLSFGANQEVFDFWRQIFKDNFSRVVKIPPQMNRPTAFSYQARGRSAKSLRRYLLARQMNTRCLSYQDL